MSAPRLDDLPGFRRRFVVTPGAGWVRSDLEDDFHCMSVTLHHAGGVVTAVEPVVARAPWNTCPGAEAEAVRTFTNLALDAFAARGEKIANCTHLYDLAILAAAHAGDEAQLVYDIRVSDPAGGERRAELRRNGVVMMGWVHVDGRIVEPVALAGTGLLQMRAWIESLDPAEQEMAKLLRWGTLMANGRTIPLERQSDATRMPPNCYTFQPDTARQARRIGEIRDFSNGAAEPLADRAIIFEGGNYEHERHDGHQRR
jgi:hypothetical protein